MRCEHNDSGFCIKEGSKYDHGCVGSEMCKYIKSKEVVLFGTDPKARKGTPLFSGCFDYFPLALGAVARRSARGQEQHNPDKPLGWDRSKSGDELDALSRHLLEGDWAGVAWRALAHLQKEMEGGYEA